MTTLVGVALVWTTQMAMGPNVGKVAGYILARQKTRKTKRKAKPMAKETNVTLGTELFKDIQTALTNAYMAQACLSVALPTLLGNKDQIDPNVVTTIAAHINLHLPKIAEMTMGLATAQLLLSVKEDMKGEELAARFQAGLEGKIDEMTESLQEEISERTKTEKD